MHVKSITGYNSRPEQRAALQARLKATPGIRARACHSHLIDLFFVPLFEVISRLTTRGPLAVWRPLRQAENKRRACWIILDFIPIGCFTRLNNILVILHLYSNNLKVKFPPCVGSSRSLRPLTNLTPVRNRSFLYIPIRCTPPLHSGTRALA